MSSEDEEQARAARAAARRNWPIRVYKLGEEPPADLSSLTTGERLEMMWQISLDTWELTGKPLPTYQRSEMPIRIVRSPVRKKDPAAS